MRAALSSQLAESLRALGDTRAARRETWGQAYDHALHTESSITAVRSTADRAVIHLDAEADRLQGEIEALRVEIAQFDYEASHV